MKKNRKIIKYSLIAYIWSFFFWGIAIILAKVQDLPILMHNELFEGILNDTIKLDVFIILFLAIIATYGPMLAYFVMLKSDEKLKKAHKSKFKLRIPLKYLGAVILIYTLITLIPSIPFLNIENFSQFSLLSVLLYVVVYFIYQLVTSGTEEIGWRGFLLPEFLKKYNAWDASVYTGIIWGFWHLPIVLYIFYMQGMGMIPILFSFVGFLAGIVASSAIHTYFYLKTHNVFFSMIIHAFGNTAPLIAGFFLENAAVISLSVQILQWVVVIYLTKKEKELFYNQKLSINN